MQTFVAVGNSSEDAIPTGQCLTCQRGAVGKRLELQPTDAGINRVKVGEGGESAVGAGDKIARTDNVGKSLDPLRDDFGVLDIVGARVDDARDEDLAVRQAVLLEHGPFVLMPRIGRLKAEASGTCAVDQIDDVG